MSFALSVGVHAIAVAVLLVGGRFSWPQPPLAIELTTHHTAARAPAPEAPPEPPRAAAGPHTPGAGKRPRPKPPAGPPPPPATQDLKPLAPETANLVVLLRADRLRKSPHREALEALLHALPDTQTLLGGTNISLLDDFDAVLIATADPRDMTATFLAARFHDEAKIRPILERPLLPGDPRVFRSLKAGLAVLTSPESAARLDGPRDLGADPRGEWLKQLEGLERVGAGENGPALLATLADAPALFRLGEGLPTPLAMALALSTEAAPALRLKAAFKSEAEAERMVQAWPQIVARYRSLTLVLGLSKALDELRLKRSGLEVEIEGRLPEAEVRKALGWARALLPQPAAPAPAVPEPTPATPEPTPATAPEPTPATAPEPTPATAPEPTSHVPALDAGAR